jgi:MSHA biogenesis protein MshN
MASNPTPMAASQPLVVTASPPGVASAMATIPGAPDADARVALAPVRATPAARIPVPSTGTDSVPALPVLAPAPAAPTPGDARVEKRPAPTTPRERAEAAYQRGLGLHAQGRVEDAEAAFMNALQEDRAHAAARLALAVSLAGHGAAGEARNLLADGLELQPRQLALASTLARLQSQNHDLPGAIATLKSAIAAGAAAAPAAEQARAYALLATLQQSALQHAPAIENYAAALRLAPDNGAWWIGMGLSLAADGRPESAREAYARARSTESLSAELQQFVDQRLR